MRWWRDESYAGDRMPQTRDDVVHFMSGKLPALARLGTLRHFDLEFVGVYEVIRGDAETSRRHLLDCAAAEIAVRVGFEAPLVFSALAGIRFAADAVHGDGKGLVGFLADGPERHCASRKAFDDFLRRLDVFQRDRCGALLQF